MAHIKKILKKKKHIDMVWKVWGLVKKNCGRSWISEDMAHFFHAREMETHNSGRGPDEAALDWRRA